MEKEALKQEETKEVTELNKEKEEETIDFMMIELSKTYRFEGQEISRLDMHGIEEMTGADLLAINRMMKRRGNTDASPEMTMEFAFFAAQQATKLPLEFFYALSMKDSMRVKARVNYFLAY